MTRVIVLLCFIVAMGTAVAVYRENFRSNQRAIASPPLILPEVIPPHALDEKPSRRERRRADLPEPNTLVLLGFGLLLLKYFQAAPNQISKRSLQGTEGSRSV